MVCAQIYKNVHELRVSNIFRYIFAIKTNICIKGIEIGHNYLFTQSFD